MCTACTAAATPANAGTTIGTEHEGVADDGRECSSRPFAFWDRFSLNTRVHPTRDHFLPPDPQAFLAAEPSTGRVIVIAPTRAACETIELALGLHLETLLEREHG